MPGRARKRRAGKKAGLKFAMTGQFVLALFILAIAILVAAASVGVAPLAPPAGQQFAPVVGGFDRCSDPDGVDFSLAGSVISVLGGAQREFQDYCASTLTLAEYYCSGNKPDVVLVDCPFGCFNGRCR